MKRRLLSLFLTAALLLGMFSTAVLAGGTGETGEDLGTVQVIVENTTFDAEKAAELDVIWKDTYWEGTLVNATVALTEASTMMSCIKAALDTNAIASVGADGSYISSINGLAERDGGSRSGWMGTLNDWFVDEGFDSFTYEDGGLCGGDVIRVMYTCDWGADLGGAFGTKLGWLASLSASEGKLEPAFAKETFEYTLTVNEDVETVDITAAAENKQDKVTVKVGETEYRRGVDIPVETDTEITITCGEKAYTVTVAQETVSAAVVVDFTAQAEGAFLCKPQLGTEVSGGLAEQYNSPRRKKRPGSRRGVLFYRIYSFPPASSTVSTVSGARSFAMTWRASKVSTACCRYRRRGRAPYMGS